MTEGIHGLLAAYDEQMRGAPPVTPTGVTHECDGLLLRGEAAEWKARGHDRPADLADASVPQDSSPEEEETVLIGRIAGMTSAAEPLATSRTCTRTPPPTAHRSCDGSASTP